MRIDAVVFAVFACCFSRIRTDCAMAAVGTGTLLATCYGCERRRMGTRLDPVMTMVLSNFADVVVCYDVRSHVNHRSVFEKKKTICHAASCRCIIQSQLTTTAPRHQVPCPSKRPSGQTSELWHMRVDARRVNGPLSRVDKTGATPVACIINAYLLINKCHVSLVLRCKNAFSAATDRLSL